MKILFVHNALTTFVRIDLTILQEDHDVEELYLKSLFDINLFAIWRSVKSNDLVFGWFASWHTFIPFLFAYILNRPSIIVAGGYDTANLPEAQYGNQRMWFARQVTNSTIRMAKHVVCNSYFTKSETIAVSGIPPERVSVVYHGLPKPLNSGVIIKNNKLVLNVGNVSRENLLRKGIKPFLDTAKFLPEYHLIQVGEWKDDSASQIAKTLGKNVELRGFVSVEDLEVLYARSKYYIQPSLHEGFGMSVVEAMQYGCIPIVSQNGALNEVIGKFGVYITELNPVSISESVRKAASSYSFSVDEIRNFVFETYTIDRRKLSLISILNLCKSGG